MARNRTRNQKELRRIGRDRPGEDLQETFTVRPKPQGTNVILKFNFVLLILFIGTAFYIKRLVFLAVDEQNRNALRLKKLGRALFVLPLSTTAR